jgi:ribonuclease E
LPAADSETVQQEDPAVDTPVVPPTPEAAKVEDVAPQQDGTKASAEPTPTPDAPLSPAENLDHLMQVSDDEKPPEDVEVPEPVPEEPAVDIPSEQVVVEDAVVEEAVVEEAVVEEVVVEEVVVPPEDTGPVAEDIKTEPMDMPNDGEDVDQSQSKPVSQASESGPAAEEGISTRRTSSLGHSSSPFSLFSQALLAAVLPFLPLRPLFRLRNAAVEQRRLKLR